MRPLILCLSLTLTLFLNTGCVLLLLGGGIGAGTAHVKGKVEANLKANVKKTHNATLQAMKKLGYIHVKSSHNSLEAEHTYRTEKDEKIKVYIEWLSDSSVHILIRVDFFGDKNLSQQILDEIKKNI